MANDLISARSGLTNSRNVGWEPLPEEINWARSLALKSTETQRAYLCDIRQFMAYWQISDSSLLHSVSHQQVIDWALHLQLDLQLKPSGIRRKLAALSSLFGHLKNHGLISSNPVADTPRPGKRSLLGSTPAFSSLEARAIMDTADPASLSGLRDRALLAIGFYTGARVSEICRLKVRDYYSDCGFRSLWFRRKGSSEGGLAINPQCANRIDAYLQLSGHAEDSECPVLLPLRSNRFATGERHLSRKTVNQIFDRRVREAGLNSANYSPHSMRATFITTAFKNGAILEDVQESVGHSSPEITKSYNRAIFTPERSASFKCDY